MKTHKPSTKQRVLRSFGFFTLFMIFCLMANPMYAQITERKVTGIVNSLDGPVFGATIVLKGTATGVISDENGKFIFPQELKQNDVLVISYLGYETDEITITGNTSFVKPFLNDNPILIIAALRTDDTATIEVENKN